MRYLLAPGQALLALVGGRRVTQSETAYVRFCCKSQFEINGKVGQQCIAIGNGYGEHQRREKVL